MLTSSIINLVMLLSFIYFITSLMITAINESISAYFNNKNNTVKDAIRNLFFDGSDNKEDDSKWIWMKKEAAPQDGEWKTYIDANFLKSPFIQPLLRERNKYPAFIPAKNFSLFVLDKCLNKQPITIASTLTANDIDSSELPTEMKATLNTFLFQAGNDLKKVQELLEEFYNNAMDRAADWYKSKAKRRMLFIACLLCVLLNIDTVNIINDSLNDPQELNGSAERIIAALPNMKAQGEVVKVSSNGKSFSINVVSPIAKKPDTTQPNGQYRGSTGEVDSTCSDNMSGLTILYLGTGGYSIGYKGFSDAMNEWFSKRRFEKAPFSYALLGSVSLKLFIKMIGVLLSAFAIQLGSNYWFGVLNKAINIRSVSKRKEDNSTDEK